MWGKKTKYGNQRVEVAGHWFDSRLEAAVFHMLKMRERAGELKNIRHPAPVTLTKAEITWKCDFSADLPSGETIYIEAKGLECDRWRIILKLWQKYGLGVLYIYKGHHTRPTLAKTIVPEMPSVE